MTVISYLTDARVVHKILTHDRATLVDHATLVDLGLPTSAPAISPAQRLDVDEL